MVVTETSLELRDFGCIASMQMPPGWSAPPEDDPSSAPFAEMRFFPAYEKDTYVSVTYTRRPEDGSILQGILSKPPHMLLFAEQNSLQYMLGADFSAKSFRALKIATEPWNHRMCIMIRGRWLNTQHDCLWLVTNRNEDCSSKQQVNFRIAQDHSIKFHPMITRSLQSIAWR
jgi:hypothetical protein